MQLNRTMPQTLIIRADAGAAFGQGHTVRNRSLAAAFRKQAPCADIIWAATEETFAAVTPLREQFKTITLPAASQAEQIARLAQALGPIDDEKPILAVDGYHLDHQTLDAAREHGIAGVTFQIDEKANRILGDHDFIVDFLPHAAIDYQGLISPNTDVLIGPGYQMVGEDLIALAAQRKKLTHLRRANDMEQIALMNGGFNIGGMLEEIIEGLARNPAPWKNTHFSAFLLSKSPSLDAVKEAHHKAYRAGIDMRLHEDSSDVTGMLAQMDLYIGAAGLTPYELGALGGIPSVVLAAGHNQEAIGKLVEKHGAGVYAGKYLNLEGNTLVRNPEWKTQHTDTMLRSARALMRPFFYEAAVEGSRAFCDGKGAERVAIKALNAKLTPKF